MNEPEFRSPSEEKRERFYQGTFKTIDETPERIGQFLEIIKNTNLP